MGGLSSSLLIGVQALDANQAALDTTSNNIANVNTPGYTREVAQFTENGENESGDEVTGGGVTLQGIQSIRDELLNIQIQQQTSQQSSANTQSSSLQQIQTSFTTNGDDIASALTAFSSSLAQLSATPDSSASQQGVLSDGQNLATAFNTTARALISAQSDADQQVPQTVNQINSLTAQIAQLNGQLSQVPADEDGGTTKDQLDQLVQQLSGLTNVAITQGTDGETITTGTGTPLVVGGQSYNLQTGTGTDGFQQVLDSNGTNITSSINGGTLGGAIQVRDQVVPGFLSQLNTLASQFTTAFNTAQGQGFDSTGAAGGNFFAVPANPNDAAAGMSVSITNPAQIAISSDGSAGSNGNVANLSAALTNTLPSGDTAASAYANLVYQVGNAASNASTQSTAIGQNITQLTNQQGAVSAVDINEETTNMLRYQAAFEAASRIVSTVQVLDNAALNMGSSTSF
ncbi:MAG: flagellar hook-associated protein FlgK [Terracidiphilus sp.]|jgi:flagellar hook-associated protein 1 FlgK